MRTSDHLDKDQAGDFEACVQLNDTGDLAEPFTDPSPPRRTRKKP
jgi:hypothetical protein